MMTERDYNASNIDILDGLEAVRLRPGMYISTTSINGLHHLVYEIVDNSVDEAIAGYCNLIDITINKDNSITVRDNGRGIPVDIQKKANKSALEVVFTVLHAGGKFGGGGYKVSGGLHGVGASVVNALSEWLTVKVYRDNKIYQMGFSRGNVTQGLTVIGDCSEDESGTEVTFFPDGNVFEETVFDYDTLKNRFRETAFLTRNLKINIKDERYEEKRENSFHYEGGLNEFVAFLNKEKNPFYRDFATRFNGPIDFDLMNKAASLLLNVIDFTSFSKVHTDTKTNNCRVQIAEWKQVDEDLWRFEITADRFLRNMVRAIVGTLIEVGRGRMTLAQFEEVIARKDRCAAADSVPGNALFLVDIQYPYL